MSPCEVNWTYVKDVVTAVCSALAVVIAFKGLDTWRRQLAGTTAQKVALDALKSVYALEHQFKIVRQPLQYTSQAKDEPAIEAERRKFQEHISLLFERLVTVRTSRFECRALIGPPALPIFDAFERIVSSYSAAVWLYFWLKDGHGNPVATVDRSPERVETNMREVFAVDDKDEITRTLATAIADLERLLAPHVGRGASATLYLPNASSEVTGKSE